MTFGKHKRQHLLIQAKAELFEYLLTIMIKYNVEIVGL